MILVVCALAFEAGGRAFAAKRSFASARRRSCPRIVPGSPFLPIVIGQVTPSSRHRQ